MRTEIDGTMTIFDLPEKESHTTLKKVSFTVLTVMSTGQTGKHTNSHTNEDSVCLNRSARVGMLLIGERIRMLSNVKELYKGEARSEGSQGKRGFIF